MAATAERAASRSGLGVATLGAIGVVAFVALTQVASVARADEPVARVYTKAEGERVNPAFEASRMGPREVSLSALAGETVSFQIVVDPGDESLDDVTVELAPLDESRGTRVVRPVMYVEQFVPVTRRSENDHDRTTSLGWTSAARPENEGMLGSLPDALIPFSVARCPVATTRSFCPYPLHIDKGAVGAVWIDLPVPADLPAGRYVSRALVRSAGKPLGSIPVALTTSTVRLPYKPVSFFAFYAYDTLQERFSNPRLVETGLWQTLHECGLDPMPALVSEGDLDRTEEGYLGRWFRHEAGYTGPGADQRPEVAAVGAYGSLGEPTPANVSLAVSLGTRLAGAMVKDRFLYTVDEDCKNPLGARWQEALRGRDALVAGRTCDVDPRNQDVDLVMMPAQAFGVSAAREARRRGKKVFVYNGQLPFTGTMMLDAPLTSLTANGWIAATYDVGRWFTWETIFWNDGNRGGLGPRDVFADAETFHNADGDKGLLDGLLLYPGKQPRFPAHSLDVDAVLPSMRLFALRRGIEDAGLVALASSVDPAAADRITKLAVPRAFDEIDRNEPAAFELDPQKLAALRAELRGVAERAHPSDARAIFEGSLPAGDTEARAELAKLRARRTAPRHVLIPASLDGPLHVGLPLAFFALGWVVVVGLARRREN